MEGKRAPAHKRLFYWLVSPLLGVLFLFAAAFYFFLLNPIEDYITAHIADSMHETVNDIYRICDQNFLESYQTGELYDEKGIRIKKAYTLGAIEDYMRRQGSMIFVREGEKMLLAPHEGLELGDKIKETARNYASGSSDVTLDLADKKYYAGHINFDPWNWQISVLRDTRMYSGLYRRLYSAYIMGFFILLVGSLFVFLTIRMAVYRPLKKIITPLRKGEKISYKGIFEFEYLGGQLQRALDAQKIEHQKYKSLVDSSPLGIHLYRLENDNRLVFIGANKAANDILHVDCRRYLGKTIEEAFPPLAETEVPDIYRRACAEGKSWHHEQVDYRDGIIDGAFEVHAFQISPGMMAAFFRDKTKELKLEAEVQKAKKIESIGILAGGIAHDFNNILTAILGNISLAKRLVSHEDDVYRKLEASEKAVNMARNLTFQLLTFAKGGAPITKPTTIDQLIRESVMFTISGSSVNCSFSVDADLLPVEVDAGQIGQVMQNIATNAVQAMPEGGNFHVALENYEKTEADSVPLPSGKYVKITLTDEGKGISARKIDKIFDPFYTDKAGGSGLGLAICYSIIKKHKGLITVESREGMGTGFHIYLPAFSGKLSAGKDTEPEQVSRGQGRILLMDDNEDVREIAEGLLSHAGYEVETVAEGREAIEFYRKAHDSDRPYDLVVLDLTVPGGSGGRDTIAKLKEINPQIKALVSSGYSNDAVMTDYAKYGFQGAVAKPYTLEKLSKAVFAVLGQDG